MTTQQLGGALLAVLAFVPAAVCTGYLVAWFSNLHGFRQRSLVERVFWSIPLSFAVSPIAAVLIGRFLSLTAVSICFALCAVICAIVLAQEYGENRRAGLRWNVGFRPHGVMALSLAAAWATAALLLLADMERNGRVYMSLAIFDHSMRVAWTQSVLRTGVPPANPLYMFHHPAPMRYYYFWYVLCAAVARMAHLQARAVVNASCVWAGFLLAAVMGLYLKHFLAVGVRLRRQFLVALGLLAVTGLGICVNLTDFFYFHEPLPGYLEAWKVGQISSWLDSLIWVPHHLASMACAMFGFLLVWIACEDRAPIRAVHVVLISAAFASCFGLSVYVAFAFSLAMIAWAFWQVVLGRSWREPALLVAGGACAVVLLAPFFAELMHSTSNVQGPSLFEWDVREMIPPAGLLATPLLHHLDAVNPTVALNLAKAILLLPGYAVELGFFFMVLLVFLISGWRGGMALSRAQGSLVFISAVILVPMSFLRSSAIDSNDFGWRAALFLQFSVLLLASELFCSWGFADRKESRPQWIHDLPGRTPYLVRSLASFALIFGVLTTAYQALMIRFTIPLREAQLSAVHDPSAGYLVRKAYTSLRGYAALDSAIPAQAIIQYNPRIPDLLWLNADWLAADHQTGIDMDQMPCGSEFGGNPNGCLPMASALDALYQGGATGAQAQATCRRLGIDYLVARVYDPAWKQPDSWVWMLHPVVADAEFRALDCR